jgi:hypothetical protein
MLITLALATVGLVQGIFTWQQIWLSRDEFHATHRPRLKVHFVRNVRNGVEITVVNTGDSDAVFVAARGIAMHLVMGDELPSPHDITTGDFVLRSRFSPSDSDRTVIAPAGGNPKPVPGDWNLIQ